MQAWYCCTLRIYCTPLIALHIVIRNNISRFFWQFENNNDIGVFAKLTSAYCLVPVGGSENFYRFLCLVFLRCILCALIHCLGIIVLAYLTQHCSVFEGELADKIPVIHCSIAGCRIVGRLTAGNRHGLLVPSSTTDQVLRTLRLCVLVMSMNSHTLFHSHNIYIYAAMLICILAFFEYCFCYFFINFMSLVKSWDFVLFFDRS